MFIRQINRLRIGYSSLSKKYQVKAPDGRVLEEFGKEKDAAQFAFDTPDFVKRRRVSIGLNTGR